MERGNRSGFSSMRTGEGPCELKKGTLKILKEKIGFKSLGTSERKGDGIGETGQLVSMSLKIYVTKSNPEAKKMKGCSDFLVTQGGRDAAFSTPRNV